MSSHLKKLKVAHVAKPHIPTPDLVKITFMSKNLPPMAMKSPDGQRVVRVGSKFVPAKSNLIDHLANLKELYTAVGMKACEEYYNTIMSRQQAQIKANTPLPWYIHVLDWLGKLIK